MTILRMVRPMRRKGSRSGQFRQRIPLDVRDKVRGLTLAVPIGPHTVQKHIGPHAAEITISLRTHDDSEVRQRQAAVIAYLENVYKALRMDAPSAITHKDAVALSGEFYRLWAEERLGDAPITWVEFDTSGWTPPRPTPSRYRSRSANPDEVAEIWEIAGAALGHHHGEPFEEVQVAAPFAHQGLNVAVDRFLLAKGLRLSEAARNAVIHEVRRALGDAFQNRQRNAGGDYSPDPKASRFPPPWQPREEIARTPQQSAKISLTGLIDAWRQHPEQEHIAQSTIASYRYTVEALAAFLKQHRSPAVNDARHLTMQMVQAFTEHRMRSGIKAKTVRDSDLSCLKALFGFAVAKGILPSNPAQGITIKIRQAPQKRQRKGFSAAEAQAILNHACNNSQSSRESGKLKAAKRWVPWLCAYSGTRVGEMAQLRKRDIKQEDGYWVITIAHEAATQKRKATWDIPLHPHLIDMGFLEFVNASEEGHLFLTPRPDRFKPDSPESRTKDPRGIMGPLQGVKNRLREFAREVVSAPDVQPSHGWRHRFKTVGRECGIEKVILDAFALHEGESVSDGYGEVTIKTMLDALMKMPKYKVP